MMNNEAILEKLIQKIRNNVLVLGEELYEYPESKDGMYFLKKADARPLYHIFNWTQSFYIGCAYWAYRLTNDEKLLKWMYGFYEPYYKKVFDTPMDTMHDLGFLYTPYAVALYKLTGDPNMMKLGIKAADELAKRYFPKGDFIQAWGRMDGKIPDYVSPELSKDIFFSANKGRVIVDSMMNLPLLFWASEVSGNQFYGRIAESHADTILKYFIREDNSLCHAFIFDVDSGAVLKEANSCGYANGSHWARGSGWAIYGFALAYSYTGKEEYLDASVRLCQKFIDECKGEMPLWDFRLPETEEASIDTSAVAIVLCAIREISKHKNTPEFRKFSEIFEGKILDYVNTDADVHGILTEQNGRHIYASYGDYYLMEYLSVKKLNCDSIW